MVTVGAASAEAGLTRTPARMASSRATDVRIAPRRTSKFCWATYHRSRSAARSYLCADMSDQLRLRSAFDGSHALSLVLEHRPEVPPAAVLALVFCGRVEDRYVAEVQWEPDIIGYAVGWFN